MIPLDHTLDMLASCIALDGGSDGTSVGPPLRDEDERRIPLVHVQPSLGLHISESVFDSGGFKIPALI